jgi:hypothetical protein
MIRRSGLALVCAVLLLAVSPAVAPAAGGAERDPFPYLGSIKLFDLQGEPVNVRTQPVLAGVHPDVGGRTVLVVLFANGARAHLVDVETLQQVSVFRVLPALPTVVAAIDPVRPRLYLRKELDCSILALCANAAPPLEVAVAPLDGSGDPAARPSFTFAGFDGHVVAAMRPVRHGGRSLLYVLSHTPVGSNADVPPTTLHALDADRLAAGESTGVLLWSYEVTRCGRMMGNPGSKSPFLGVSRTNDFAYLGCSAQRHVTDQVGTNFAVRVNFGAADPAKQLPAGFTIEHHPVAADLEHGFSSGDQVGERLFILGAGGDTNRFYAWDARRRSFVGSVPLDMSGDGTNIWGAVADPATGRAYIKQQQRVLVATDAGELPVPQGSLLPLGDVIPVSSGHPAFDPGTRRLFMPGFRFDDLDRKSADDLIRVYEDRTPPPEPTVFVDPDDATEGIEEGPETQVSFSAQGSAFGARALAVGGIGASPARPWLETFYTLAEGRVPQPKDGDRGSFQGFVQQAQLSGSEQGADVVAATAVRAAIDESTESDAANFPDPPDQVLDQLAASSCSSARSDEPQAAANPGSSAVCDLAAPRAAGAADATAQHADLSEVLRVASTESSAVVERGADGAVAVAEAVARGVTLALPGLGSLHIDEIRSWTRVAAAGRPGSTSSELDAVVNGARVVAPDGETAFTCGSCEPAEVAVALNRAFPQLLQAHPGQPALDPHTKQSPGGARAVTIKEPYAYWNDFNVNGDDRFEVAALQIVLFHDGKASSREVIQLAAVFAGTGYTVKALPEAEPAGPAALGLALADDLGEPLAGGVFEVRTDPSGGVVEQPEDDDADGEMDADGETDPGSEEDGSGSFSAAAEEESETTEEESEDAPVVDPLVGELIEDGVCVTGDDGIGDCVFEDIAPGAYVVVQTSAPAGYAPAEPFPVTVSPGFATLVAFVNVRAVAAIEITLTDDADPPAPLAGGEFVTYVDDGDLVHGDADVELGRCTTDASGSCDFPEVPLGSFVVRQSAAPPGLMKADDVGFALTEPRQVAALAFVNGAEGAPGAPVGTGSPGAAPAPTGATATPFSPTPTSAVSLVSPPPLPPPTVTQTPFSDLPEGGRGPLSRMVGLPSDMVGFLARSPGEALLVMAVWLLLCSPVYLAVRRRQLNLVKDVA